MKKYILFYNCVIKTSEIVSIHYYFANGKYNKNKALKPSTNQISIELSNSQTIIADFKTGEDMIEALDSLLNLLGTSLMNIERYPFE